MQQQMNNAVVVSEQPRRRRLVGLIGAASLGAAMLAGVTIAAFTDSEYAHFGGDSMKAGAYNIQIRAAGSPNWMDTTIGDPDNGTDDDNPIELTISPNVTLVPGDPSYKAVTTVEVRNADASMPTDLTVKLADYKGVAGTTTTAAPTDSDLLDNLVFNIKVSEKNADDEWEQITPTGGTGRSIADLGQAPFKFATGAAAGKEYQLEITTHLKSSGDPATDNTMQGKPVHLMIKVDGESV